MYIALTNNIRISVETKYEDQYSDPSKSVFIFSYQIKIENIGTDIVQLMKRHWFIRDSSGSKREIVGDGVIGKQPVLYPDDIHQYESACDLTSEIGNMYGSYLMRIIETNEFFEVKIPMFKMIAPQKLN